MRNKAITKKQRGGFVPDIEDDCFWINYHEQETDEDYGIVNRWLIESRTLEDALRKTKSP